MVTSGDGLAVYIHAITTGDFIKRTDIDASVYHVIAPQYDVTVPTRGMKKPVQIKSERYQQFK